MPRKDIKKEQTKVPAKKREKSAHRKAKRLSGYLTPTYDTLVSAIESLVMEARAGLKAAMNAIMLQTYWRTGEYIVEYEQNGSDRAVYGEGLMRRLARDLSLRLGRGFSHSNLIYMRKLYVASQKSQTSDLFQKSQMSGFLTWSHYLEILRTDDPLEIAFYAKECENSKWSVRELHRQMQSMLFHRIALSRNKEGMLALAEKGASVQKPEDILRDPYVLEFAGLPISERLKEGRLHAALVEHLRDFLLELGRGFSFVASQYRIPLNTDHPCRVDLVFYNFLLKCFVLIDLKRGMVKHQDIGQMNMYLNYFKSEVGGKDDAEPVGIVLGANKDDLVVQFATQGISNHLFVSKYQLYLPDENQLRGKLAALLDVARGKRKSRKQ
ncbi:MAG: DUF1016 family protein [Victivallales bacterium]|nr:DUF1016 family protein [Victivallales bacterium]